MAKSIKEIQEQLKALREEQKQIRVNAKEYQKLKNTTEELTESQKIKLKLFEEEHKKYEQNSKSIGNLNKRLDYTKKKIRDATKDAGELDDAFLSISNAIGKSNGYSTLLGITFNKTLETAESISTELQKGAGGSVENTKSIEKALSAYKTMQVSIAQINKQYIQGKISNEDRIGYIKSESEAFQDVAHSIDMSEVNSKELKNGLEAMVQEGKSFGESMKKAQLETQALDNVFGSFSGIPAMGELNTLLKTNIKDTLAWKAAIFAVGAALGKAAYDYFGAPIKAGLQADKERQQNEIDTIANVAKLRKDAESIPLQIAQEKRELEINTAHEVAKAQFEAAYAGQRAAHEFSVSMQTGAAQFERASKTALFGNKLGSVGYGAAQLQLAGISADKIAGAMEAASAATGKMPSARVGADMSIMAERTGQSVDDIASINEYLQRTEKVTSGVAMNLQEGMRAMADKAGVSLGKLMKDIAESSKDALSYNIKSGKALAKQVAYASSIGVNFSDVAKAGKNMVLNYKDSIKAEMQLSSLLGEQVDLSEVRAKFAEGDTEGAMKALKAQGLDPATMDMFQQQALSDALGGLDLSSISKVAQNTGAQVGALEGASAQKGNQGFLGKTEKAEKELGAKTAQISAESAVFDAKLSGEIAKKFLDTDAELKFRQDTNLAAQSAEELAGKMKDLWLKSDEYKKSLEDSMKLDFVSGLKETLMGGLAAALGGLGTSLLSKGAGMLFGGKKGKGGKAPAGGGGGGIAGMVTGGAEAVAEGAAGDGMLKGATSGIKGKAGAGMLKGATSGIKGVSSVLQTLTKEIGGVLKTLIKTLQTVGNQLITAVSDMLKKVLTSVKSLGGQLADTLGSVVGKIVDNVGSILTKATDIVINIGNKLATGVGSILTKIGTGLGKGIGELIEGVMKGLAGGLKAFADPLILVGAGILAGSITVIGAGIAGAAWILGKALPTLAEGFMAFNGINGDNLKGVGLGVAALGVGMAAMGAGAVLSGIGNLVGSLFGGGIEDTIKKVEKFAEANINADKVKNNADAIVAYSKAMAASGLGNAASGLGNMVGGIANGIASFFGAKTKPPLKEMEEFGKLDIGNPEKIKQNAEVFTAFGNAMASYKGSSGTLGGVLGDALAGFFKVKPPIQEMKDFAKEDFGKDKERIKANAEAFTAFGNAMASYKGSSGGLMEVLAQGVADYFKIPSPMDEFQKFAAIPGINVEQVKNNAEAFTAFGNAMSTYQGGATEGFWSSLGSGIASFFGAGERDIISDFERFSKINATGLVSVADGVGKMSTSMQGFPAEKAASIGEGLQEFVDYINDGELDTMTLAGPIISALAGNLVPFANIMTMLDPAKITALGVSMGSFGTTVGTSFNSDLVTSLKGVTDSFNSGFVNGVTQLSAVSAQIDLTALAISNLAASFNELAKVDINAVNSLPWLKLIAFSAASGKIQLVQSANKSFNITQDTAKNIETIKTNDKINTDKLSGQNNEMIRLTKNVQALVAVLANSGEAAFQLNIDGKAVTNMIKKRADNAAAGKSPD